MSKSVSDIVNAAKPRLDMQPTDTASDALLTSLAEGAKAAILEHKYQFAATLPTELPANAEAVWLEVVIMGYTVAGAENQTSHMENGVSRVFKHPDILSYIRAHVVPMAGGVFSATTTA